MHNILLIGAGKIGATITELLVSSGDYRVTVADADQASLHHLPALAGVEQLLLDASDPSALQQAMQDKYAVLHAGPFYLTRAIVEAAVAARIHYLDLTEDIASTQLVRSLAHQSERALIPQCGLAPGFISIVAYDLSKQFDSLENVHMRVGALPKYPTNALKYNLTWSTEGLINEYCKPCEAIVEGKLVDVAPLEDIETFSLDGINYEAFNTSGGLGTLCDTLAGKVRNLNYRTVRYPGHRDVMKLLLQDLRLRDRPELMKDILENALPITYQDVVLIFVNVSGRDKGRLVQKSYAHKVYNKTLNGQLYSAIQITTAASICAVLDLLAAGKLPQQGFVKQEDILFSDFINNRFGKYYAQPAEPEGGAASAAAAEVVE